MPRPARSARRGRSSRPGPAAGARRPANAQRPGADFAPPETSTPPLPPVESFADLEMPAPFLTTLTARGVTAPFPIQAATLPNALAGRDVLGRGRTGSGKTLAFGLALLARTAGRRAEPRSPLALVLVPTRELAQQVTDALTPYAESVGLRTTTVVGGMSITRQAAALASGADVLVATPGRLADLIERGDCRLGRVRITVLDEADQMTDMGFLPQVTRLLEQTPPDGQRMLFSATLDRNVDRLVRAFLHDPVTHSVDPPTGVVTTMEHHLLHVADTDKHETTVHVAARRDRVIMFVAKKHAADRLVRKLTSRGVSAAALHGGKTQSQRNRALEGFRTEAVTVLVATDVAARGIHIDDLDLVVNIDPPADHKDYLHRSGRTARAGRTGTVVTFVLPDQRRDVDAMMAATGITPHRTNVRPGDGELARITGARTPDRPPPAPAGGAGGGTGRGGGRGSGGGAGRGAGSGGGGGRGAGARGASAAPPREPKDGRRRGTGRGAEPGRGPRRRTSPKNT
ncbi:DEAD/DEAH box helicase [Actinomadura algeriensis]|uniref:Superfamily II DNA/RNA helicase n=1 Tax=Actinomadura algeriensis TaxID=1679523 RepID=A0ABR9K3P0_9ACTN|nr:DEAD/DEAH box helicase [Actinomadura algeriensis]MBE1537471.1 superfamily II DNA/RNA helicase [Actinomadura algeriensis]